MLWNHLNYVHCACILFEDPWYIFYQVSFQRTKLICVLATPPGLSKEAKLLLKSYTSNCLPWTNFIEFERYILWLTLITIMSSIMWLAYIIHNITSYKAANIQIIKYWNNHVIKSTFTLSLRGDVQKLRYPSSFIWKKWHVCSLMHGLCATRQKILRGAKGAIWLEKMLIVGYFGFLNAKLKIVDLKISLKSDLYIFIYL